MFVQGCLHSPASRCNCARVQCGNERLLFFKASNANCSRIHEVGTMSRPLLGWCFIRARTVRVLTPTLDACCLMAFEAGLVVHPNIRR
jgi:hypothetical protein